MPARKLVPVTVTVVFAAPATTEDGLSDVMVGFLTVSVLPGDTAVLVFLTVTDSVQQLVREAAGTVAVIEVAVPAVTVNWVAPTYTVDPAVKLPLVSVVPGRKLVPVMVIVVSGEPATTDDGVIDVILGPLTVNVLAVEVAVLVFLTVRL